VRSIHGHAAAALAATGGWPERLSPIRCDTLPTPPIRGTRPLACRTNSMFSAESMRSTHATRRQGSGASSRSRDHRPADEAHSPEVGVRT
jgi:hypothetical protein